MLHASARIIFCISKRVDVHPFLNKLYWLPIEQRIIFSLLTNTYKALNKLSPDYISSTLHYHQATRTLRSTNDKKLQQPRWNLKTYGYRAFSIAAPREWNLLPLYLCDSESFFIFKKSLKNYLFKLAYDC